MLTTKPCNLASDTMSPDVLIIDDDQAQLDELMLLVSSLGFNCLSADCGLSGLAQIQQNPGIGIILLDIFMPEINGLEFLQRLQSPYYRQRNLQCLLLTGAPQMDHVIDGLDQGAIGFLIKPITYADLKGRLTRASIRYCELQGSASPDPDLKFKERLTCLVEVIFKLRRLHTPLRAGGMPGPAGFYQALSSEFEDEASEPRLKLVSDNKPSQGNMLINFVGAAKLFSNVHIALENLNLGQETLRILVEIVVARLKGQALPVTALCHAANIPQTTALRRIDELTRKGLITKSADPKDRRRLLVTLTEQGINRLSQVGALF